jgi:predicted RNA binding protein YcfA (HicA-like mRNA interferase family)
MHEFLAHPIREFRMKVRDLLNLLEENGWQCVRTRGSHRQFRHPENPLVITVAGHPSIELPTGTLRSILKKAGIEQ